MALLKQLKDLFEYINSSGSSYLFFLERPRKEIWSIPCEANEEIFDSKTGCRRGNKRGRTNIFLLRVNRGVLQTAWDSSSAYFICAVLAR